jgi:hypothetical protein
VLSLPVELGACLLERVIAAVDGIDSGMGHLVSFRSPLTSGVTGLDHLSTHRGKPCYPGSGISVSPDFHGGRKDRLVAVLPHVAKPHPPTPKRARRIRTDGLGTGSTSRAFGGGLRPCGRPPS